MTSTEATYRTLLGKLMQHDSAPLVNAYAAIEDLLKDVQKYVNVWLQYQSLWDMESGNIYGRLEVDLAQWQKLLMDVKYVLFLCAIIQYLHILVQICECLQYSQLPTTRGRYLFK